LPITQAASGLAEPPVISVVIPTYNRAPFLREVLDSVFAQRDCPPFEVVLVDDASTDDTAAVLAALPEPVEVVRLRRNGGVAAARQAGVARARGTLLAFHDSDDLMLPGRLARLADYLAEHPEVGAVVADGETESETGAPQGRVVPPALATRLAGRRVGVREILRDGLPVYLQSALIRRVVFEEAGGIDATLDRHADLEMVSRLSLAAPLVFLNEPVFRYRLHGANQTRNRLRLREGLVVVMRRLRTRRPEALALVGRGWFRRRESRHLYRIARTRWRAGDAERARLAIREALGLAPASLRCRWLAWRIARGRRA